MATFVDESSTDGVTMAVTTLDCLERYSGLSAYDRDRLAGIAQHMPFVADISRSDLLLYTRCGDGRAVVVAQARPHSILPIHADDSSGRQADPKSDVAVYRALRWGRRVKGNRSMIVGVAPVVQQVWAIRGEGGRIIAALSVESNFVADVRQKSRSRVFQRAVIGLQKMLLLGEIAWAEALTPFREHDGVLVVDSQRVIRYASGIATERYRRLGYQDSLVGRHLSSLDTGDIVLFGLVAEDLHCHEAEFEERPYLRDDHQLVWIRKAVPLISYPLGRPWWKPWEWFRRQYTGVLLTIHDATEERRKERERKIQAAMVQEIHHRVKNNLQTVAALLRMQMRRSKNAEVRQALKDSVGRVISMAVVHEYLSRAERQAINIREVTQHIIQEIRQGVLSPEKQIRVVLEPGNNLYLPARQATACALVINELLQNAVEHGFEGRSSGTITVRLEDEGDEVCITITDDGEGLPSGFDLAQMSNLGLQIVQTLVQEDLGGSFEIRSEGGVQVTIRFSKKVWEGDEHWNAQG